LLGGTDGECPPPHTAFEDPVTFEGDAHENPNSLGLTLVLCTQRLLPCAYPAARVSLSDRVLALREGQTMTFVAIAHKLVLEGWKGARGAALGANAVFSVYKKRKASETKRSAPVRFWLRKIVASTASKSPKRSGEQWLGNQEEGK
jgi:hypothetical protein